MNIAESFHEALELIKQNEEMKRNIEEIKRITNTKKQDWELERLIRACKGNVNLAIKTIKGY